MLIVRMVFAILTHMGIGKAPKVLGGGMRSTCYASSKMHALGALTVA